MDSRPASSLTVFRNQHYFPSWETLLHIRAAFPAPSSIRPHLNCQFIAFVNSTGAHTVKRHEDLLLEHPSAFSVYRLSTRFFR
jgi:hypothetical protein